MKKLFLATLLMAISVPALRSQTLAEAETLIEAGAWRDALAILEPLGAKEPRNGKISMALGDCYLALGQDSLAKAEYTKAKARNINEASVKLADIAVMEYRVDDANELLEGYRKALKKSRKPESDEAMEVAARLDRLRNMLMRVEQIEVFDSINVPSTDFFKYYKLSPESGSLHSAGILPKKFSHGDATVVYEPESGNEMIWAAPGSNGQLELVRSVGLYGDEWDTPTAVGPHLGEGGDANYPFMMSDGITLYYANNGSGSIGGYDIFISRSNGTEFLQPQNLGMPYNSPYNDYMLAIDETTGAGWWATDRNQLADSVTIYMFVPAEIRRNVDVNDPDLRARAQLSSIAVTQRNDADYTALRKAIKNIQPGSASLSRQCEFAMPDGRIITRIEQLTNPDARQALRQYIELLEGIEADSAELARLRKAFAEGDTSVKIDILSIENRAAGDREALKRAANEVVKCENGQ